MHKLIPLITFFSHCLYSLRKLSKSGFIKSKHRMEMLVHGKVVKSHSAMISRGGKTNKRKDGDNVVPEGHYILDYKNPDFTFS